MTCLAWWWRRVTRADYGRHAASPGQPTPHRRDVPPPMLRRAR